jgi:hypothetical protein
MSAYPNRSTKTNSSIKPKQRIPKSEKNDEWGEQSGSYYRSACYPAVDEAEAMRAYRLANGELDEADYLYVTDPINTTRKELKSYPARMRNYDIISPVVSLLMGEKAKRVFPPVVYAKNHNHQSGQMELHKKLLTGELQKQFINQSIALGVPLSEETMTSSLEDITKRVQSMPDEITKMGQSSLEYIMDYNDLPREFRKGFFDWICQACVYSYRDVIRDRTYYESISPIYMSYLCSPHIDFIENGEAQKVSHKLSINEIWDRFGEDEQFKKNKDLKEFLDSNSNNSSGSATNNAYTYGGSDQINLQHQLFANLGFNNPDIYHSVDYDVDHIVWRSQAKIGKVEILDLFGNIDYIYVDEDFKGGDEYKVVWDWVDEIWETYCIADMFYVCTRPIPIQRGEYNRPQKAKLLYNGRNMFARHTRPMSLVRKGEAFQKNVNIIKYRAERSLLKSLDSVILFPLGLIPKKEGWDEEKFMYYVQSFGFLFFDDTRPNAQAMVQAMKNLDAGVGEFLLRAGELVAGVKQEYEELCGINRQRKGQMNASDGKATSEYALNASYISSEELFLEFEEFERRDYECMMDLSKFAFSKGMIAQYVKTNGQRAFLNIADPTSYVNSDFGVFVRNGAAELQKLNVMKQQVQPFVQNGAGGKAISGLLQADNFADIDQIMDEMDAKLAMQQEQDRQVQLQIQQSNADIANKELQYKYDSDELASYTDIQVALIKEGMQLASDLNTLQSGANPDVSLVEEHRNNLEENALKLMENATKLKEIASRERIAKDNNKTKLKNKTSGEK